MILLDLNQVMISNLMMQISKSQDLQEDMIRHMVLNSIRMYKQKFSDKYGEIVICCDDKNYWRKEIFPYYKAHRKADREKSTLDWNAVFEILNKIRDELKTSFPYKVIQVPHAEADDVIATLCHRFGKWIANDESEKILIVSGDKDFAQLQKYINVDQFSPVLKKWINVSDPGRFLREHILKGDRGDGVPNILSNDSCIIMGERQKPLSAKKMEAWIDLLPEDFCDTTMLRNFYRNKQMVDLDMIPKEITEQINNMFDSYETPKRNGMLNYFIKHRLKLLTEHISEF
jgi:hypothetical protein